MKNIRISKTSSLRLSDQKEKIYIKKSDQNVCQFVSKIKPGFGQKIPNFGLFGSQIQSAFDKVLWHSFVLVYVLTVTLIEIMKFNSMALIFTLEMSLADGLHFLIPRG